MDNNKSIYNFPFWNMSFFIYFKSSVSITNIVLGNRVM